MNERGQGVALLCESHVLQSRSLSTSERMVALDS
jgi:hypothetical protein